MTKTMLRVSISTWLVGVCCHAAALADPQPIDEPPHDAGSNAIVAAEVALIGASSVAAIYNGRMALRGEPGVACSLLGVVAGVGALSAATSSESELEAFSVVAGMSAVLTGVARLAQERLHRTRGNRAAAQSFQVEATPDRLGIRVRF